MFILTFSLVSAEITPVNLIKNSGFEKDTCWRDSVWATSPEHCIAVADPYNDEEAHTGFYSGLTDTWERPEGFVPGGYELAFIIQRLTIRKKIKDLDSLFFWMYPVYQYRETFHYHYFAIELLCTRPNGDTLRVMYAVAYPGYSWRETQWWKYFFLDAPPESTWSLTKRDLYEDIVRVKGIEEETTLDSVILVSYSMLTGGTGGTRWEGQKVYWDDIRITGYADYDIGVEEILSSDTCYLGGVYYPKARIRNYGREDMENFYVYAEILSGKDVLYEDSYFVSSLPSDSSMVVEFKGYEVKRGVDMLRVYTQAILDECDEDDIRTRVLFTGVEEEKVSGDFLVYPSIFKDFLYIRADKDVRIYDIEGRLIKEFKGKKVYVWDGRDGDGNKLPPGIYFVNNKKVIYMK